MLSVDNLFTLGAWAMSDALRTLDQLETSLMPRTAPTIDFTGSAPAYVRVSYRFIDFSGDLRTVSIDVDATDATDANIEALAVALGAGTNADMYGVEITQIWNAVADASNALDPSVVTTDKSASVFDNIVIASKNVTNQSKRLFVPAPTGALMVGGTDQVDGTSTPLANILTAYLALITTGGYSITGARYTERREINEQVKI